MLTVHELRKKFGALEVVRGVSFEVRAGECYGLLGPNGAGKTTTLRCCLGLTAPDSGEITLDALPVPARAREARARVGVVPQFDNLDPDFTVRENLAVYGRYFGLSRQAVAARVPYLLEYAGLAEKADAPIEALSGGMKRRLTIARALVNDPRVLFLDEPTTGLDPQGRRQLWEVVREFARLGKTIVLTTHYLDEAEQLADRVGVIINGQLVEVGTPREIGGRERALARVTFALTGNLAGRPLPETAAETVSKNGRVTITTATPTAVVTALARWAEANGEPELPALAVSRPSLEDIYLAMVEAADGQADHKGSDA